MDIHPITALIAFVLAEVLFILWVSQEGNKEPVDRNRAAHAIIRTWEAIRSGVLWAFSKARITRA